MRDESAPDPAVVEFCGESRTVLPDRPVRVGRGVGEVVDLKIDPDNAFLHRIFLVVSIQDGLTVVDNVGTQLTATLFDAAGRAETWLASGARVPLVFERTTVVFTAGPTTYDLDIVLAEPFFRAVPPPTTSAGGDMTVGPLTLTADQRLLCLVLCEPILRRGRGSGRGQLPASAAAARRLGWTTTKYNRKLDNVCEKFARLGVRGLTPTPGQPASGRRARLVEYLLASRVVTREDLDTLEARLATAQSRA